MASDKKLTRYASAVTIVTADVMNSLYGGEYGYNDSVDGFHPLVFGHVHDGTHEDGHASKILLTNGAHVRGYLGNANLGGTDGTTPAVRYSNIMCYSDATYGSPAARRAAAAAGGYDLEVLAIPEFVENSDGSRCYYLDLSNSAGGINGSIQYNENGSFSGNNDLVYDYTNLRFGAGTSAPQRKVHIVDNAHPPLRVEGITAGTGTVLVVDGNGDVYSDTSIGNQNLFDSVALSNAGGGTQTGDATITADSTADILTLSAGANITLDGDATSDTITISATGDQDLFESVALNNAGGGTQTGDATITADTTTDTLTLSAGTNITLDGNAGSDTITISATGATPGGSDTSIQFNDLGTFGGDSAFLYNKVASGTGPNGPRVLIRNLAASDIDLDRRTGITFAGKDGANNDVNVSSLVSRHATYGGAASIGVTNAVNAGSLWVRTNNPTTGNMESAILVAAHSARDNKAHVGIGATAILAPVNGFVQPARRLHIMEDYPDPPLGYSPLRINNLRTGVGSIVLWDGTGTPSATNPHHQGDVYHLANGGQGEILRIGASGYPEWSAASLGGNSFDEINIIAAGSGKSTGVTSGDTTPAAEAATSSDTLTLEAGSNIRLNGTAASDKITISAPNKVYSQWLEAGNWVPYNGIAGRAPKYTQIVDPTRNITYKYVADNSSSVCSFSTTVCVPVDGQLTGGIGTSTSGSHNTSLPNYRDPIPNFLSGPTDVPSSCRITAYFILDKSHTASPPNGDLRFNVNASFGSNGTLPANSIIAASDAMTLQSFPWNNFHSSSDPLTNVHNYGPNIPNGTVVVSDFSPLKLDIGDIKDGLATFALRVDGFDPNQSSWLQGLDGDNLHIVFRLIGARILWIWE